MIGAAPTAASCLASMRIDNKGFILTGGNDGFERTPYATSAPCIHAVGDVRAHSVKRVVSAVAEGSVVISDAHLYLAGQWEAEKSRQVTQATLCDQPSWRSCSEITKVAFGVVTYERSQHGASSRNYESKAHHTYAGSEGDQFAMEAHLTEIHREDQPAKRRHNIPRPAMRNQGHLEMRHMLFSACIYRSAKPRRPSEKIPWNRLCASSSLTPFGVNVPDHSTCDPLPSFWGETVIVAK